MLVNLGQVKETFYGPGERLRICKTDGYSAVGTGRSAPPASTAGISVYRPAAFDPDGPHVTFINTGAATDAAIADLNFKTVQPREDFLEVFLGNVAVIAY